MAQVTEVKFGDLQMDKRYKRLDRTLKLASLRMRSTKENESWPSLTSPSISSINPDPFDSSNCVPSLHSSRIGSIVSSSNNLKDILLRKMKDLDSNHNRITTSSVKKFNKESDWSEDRIMMPPPVVDKVLHSSKQLNNLLSCKDAKSTAISQKQCNSSYGGKSRQDNNYKLSYDSQKYDERFNTIQSTTANIQSGKVRIFRKWRVMLNDQYQLLIKGTLECGQVARSKPVVRRLTSTTVESVFKHAYHLQGVIVDDEYELPDYVRGKFYNGFPDDWENVYQIWKNFVQGGSVVTFRWPTPVADSDDDLKSEITDITFAYSKSPKDKMSDMNSFKESHLSSFALDSTYNILQTRNKHDFDMHNSKKCDSFTQTHSLDTIDSSFSAQPSVVTSKSHFNSDKENSKKQEAAAVNQSHVNSKVNSLKEKLNVVVNNLTDKNCPQECITKIIEMFDCLNYVVSHGSFNNVACSETEYNECAIQGQHSRMEDVSLDSVQDAAAPLKNTADNKTTNCHNLLQKKRTFTEMDRGSKRNASDSESEIYTGTPMISMERILRRKETLMKPCKRKIKKRTGSPRQGTAEKQCVSDVSPVTPNCITENYTSSTRSKETNAMKFNDSSVSITEDEGNNRRIDRYIGRSDQNNVDKHIESDRVRRWKREHLDNPLKHKNQLEMQEHFIEENAPPEPTEFRYGSCGALKRNERESVAEIGKNETTGPSFYGEPNSEKRNGITNYQHQSSPSCQQSEKLPSSFMDNKKQVTKPVILSSIPIVTSTTNNRLNDITQAQMAIQELQEEIKRYENSSPTKLIDNRRADSNLLMGTKQQLPEERVKTKLNDTGCSTKKSLRDNVEAPQSNQPTEISTPKLLSAWTPKVLGKSELHLIFEGKLLNEAGHIVHRKFKTDIVLRRVSQKLIETINHDFYQLVGDLNDTKHVVPKELLNQCRYGCPLRIDKFCKTWNALQRADSTTDVSAKLNETSVDAINVAVSSKGRRIIPPLSYWTGERIALKDNNPVYSPGNLQDSLTICSNESSARNTSAKNTSAKNTKQGRSDKSKKDSVIESENISPSSSGILANDNENKTSRTEQNRPKETRKKNKITAAQKLSDSSDDDCTSVHKRKKTRTRQRESSTSARVPSKPDTRSSTADNLVYESGFNTAESTPRKMRTRGNKEASHIGSSKEMTSSNRLSAGKYYDAVYTYYKNIPIKDDILSDDQVSHV